MRRPSPVRRLAAAAVVPLTLASLAACGSDADETEPSATTSEADSRVDEAKRTKEKDRRAARKTQAQVTAEAAPTSTPATQSPSAAPSAASTEKPSVGAAPMTAAELVRRVSGAMVGPVRMTLQVEGPMSSSAAGVLDYSSTPPSMDVAMKNSELGGDVHVVLVDGFVYMNMGPLSNSKYLKTSLESPQGLAGADVTSQLDPKQALTTLQKAITSVTPAGAEEVGGTTTQRYTVVIDPSKVGAGAGSGMPKRITYGVWLDDQDRIRRTVMGMGTNAGVVTTELSEWGVPVSIEAPPADQVAELPAR